jgi:hypothetical protein
MASWIMRKLPLKLLGMNELQQVMKANFSTILNDGAKSLSLEINTAICREKSKVKKNGTNKRINKQNTNKADSKTTVSFIVNNVQYISMYYIE